MAKKILNELGNNFKNKKVSILGLSFKPETDDMRDSPSLDIIPILQEKGVFISAYDPVAMDEAKKLLKNIEFANDLETCLHNSDALVILTEWNEFRSLFPDYLGKHMKGNTVIDLRNALDPENFVDSNFNLVQIGRARKTNQ
jgi:UDPglucose 6-dehydrogenase